MDRRTFLSVAAATPVVFGLRELFGQSPVVGVEGDWYQRALESMSGSNRPGVVFAVPDDAEAAGDLGRALFALVDNNPLMTQWDAEAQAAHTLEREAGVEALRVAVLVCLPKSAVSARFGKATDISLLDMSGKLMLQDDFGNGPLEPGFATRLRKFIVGAKGERLQTLATEVQARMRPDAADEIQKALRILDAKLADDDNKVLRATELLREHAPRTTVWLTSARENAKGGNARIEKILNEVARRDAPHLPFGTVLPKFRSYSGCGATWEEVTEETEPRGEDLPMIACGMAMPSPKSRRFLRFLSK